MRFSGTPEPGYGETGERNRQNVGQIPWRRKRRNPSGQCVSEKKHQRPPDCAECPAIPACGISIGKATYKTGSVGFHFISFTELFDGKTTSKVLSQKTQDEEQAVAGIRDNDIRKNGVGMLTAVTENPHHTEV